MNGVTPTVVVLSGFHGTLKRLDEALESVKPLTTVAMQNGNRLHMVFLGGVGSSTAVAQRLVQYAKTGVHGAKADDVHLIVGPREIGMLVSLVEGKCAVETLEYLKRSKFLECIGPGGMDGSGSKGLWVKYNGTAGMVGMMPGDAAGWRVADTPRSLIQWKNEINTLWRDMVVNAGSGVARYRDECGFWLGPACEVGSTTCPTEGLHCGSSGSSAVFAQASLKVKLRPFGSVQRTMTTPTTPTTPTSVSKHANSMWIDLAAQHSSLYWAASTWCGSTSAAFERMCSATVNRNVPIDKLQYDVSCTLSSLVQHSELADALAQPQFPWRSFGCMRGQLGPVVKAGRENKELMRSIHWTCSTAPDVMMLLPEAYVRFVLQDYGEQTEGLSRFAGRVMGGEMVLSNAAAIPLRRPDVSEAEQLFTAQLLGPRIWRLAATASTASDHVFDTCTSCTDPLVGLFVKWTFAPGEVTGARDMPTLDIAKE